MYRLERDKYEKIINLHMKSNEITRDEAVCDINKNLYEKLPFPKTGRIPNNLSELFRYAGTKCICHQRNLTYKEIMLLYGEEEKQYLKEIFDV